MRILHVIPAYYPAVRYGGPIRSAHGLCAALAARGHDVHVFTTTMDGSHDLDVPLRGPVLLDGVRVHYFRVPALRRLCWSPAMGRRLETDVATFDVAHLHSVYLWPTLKAARCASAAGVPYLLAPRGMLMRDAIRGRNPWVKQAWIQLAERRSLREAARLHVTAPAEADEAALLGVELPPIDCIPNGVDLPARYASLRSGPFAWLPRQYALFLSRINWKKGLDRLIRAWRHVPDLPLVVAGNDEEAYTPRLQRIAAEAGVADRVHFIGPVADEHKWGMFQAAEMFVLPSYSENFGNVVAEAMAVGCPVVVSGAVGIAPLVREFGAGEVISGEPDDIAAAVERLRADPERRSAAGENGRRAITHTLQWPAIAAQMESAYRRAMRLPHQQVA